MSLLEGSNPERLQKECQQLQNHNKYLQSQLDEQKRKVEAAELASSKAIEEASRMAGQPHPVPSIFHGYHDEVKKKPRIVKSGSLSCRVPGLVQSCCFIGCMQLFTF